MRATTKFTRFLLVGFAIIAGFFSAVFCFGVVTAASSVPTKQISLLEQGTPSPECWPLDVVMLVDESLSMSRANGNDPQGYRFIAAKEILNLLISNRRAQCTEAIHRFGVIAFGDYVSTTVSLAPVDILPDTDREDWSRSIMMAIDDIADYPAQNGTDPRLAFEAADALLGGAPVPVTADGYGPRRQVVILLTDGNPEGVNVGRIESYMQDLSQSLGTSSWSERSIWIVALNAKYLDNPAYDGKTMRQVWSDIATSHGGRLLGEDDYSEQTIPDALGTIIDEEFGQPGEKIQCGDFYVDPYLQSVRFVFSKRLEYQDKMVILSKLDDDTDEVLHRYIAGNTDFTAASSQMVFREDLYRRDGIIEEYQFDFPLPGKWHFTVEGLDVESCRLGVDARQTTRAASVRLVEPRGVVAQSEVAPYYDVEALFPLTLRLEALDGKPIPLPDYPLTIIASLRLPGGQSVLPNDDPLPTYTFSLAEDGLWQSEPSYILAPEVGVYTLNLSGVSVHKNPPEEYAVFTTTVSYEVKKLGRLRFEIQSPTEGQSLPCNDVQDRTSVGRPIPIAIQLFDPINQMAAPDFYLTSMPEQSFEATFLDAGGNPLDTVMLTPSSQKIGYFEGVLMESIPNIVGCGQVSAQVVFSGTVDDTRFVLPLHTQAVSFRRPQSEVVLVKVTAPTTGTFLLHPDFWSARHAEVVVPVPLAFTLTDLNENSIAPADVAKTSPEMLYRAELLAPDGTGEVLTLTVAGGTFRASGGLTFTEEGLYTFKVTANPDAFREGYISGDTSSVTVNFERRDMLWTKPATFRTTAVSSFSFLAFLVALAVYLLTGAPRGTLEITEFARPTQTLAGPFGLSRGRFPTFKGTALAGLGVKYIRARKTKSLEGGRAVYVKIVGANGEEVFNNILEVDQSTPIALSEDVEIVYR
ncbi:MAG: VWA domain-containing protein [Anaerolineae bacterium]|nr:VWA domain-containing protein [Anaerolineae bacterium]